MRLTQTLALSSILFASVALMAGIAQADPRCGENACWSSEKRFKKILLLSKIIASPSSCLVSLKCTSTPGV